MPFPQDQIAWLLVNRAKIARFLFIPQLLVALIFLGFAFITGKVHARLLIKGTPTQGRIIGFKQVRMNERSSSTGSSFTRTVNLPLIEFLADDRMVRLQEWKASRSDPGVNSIVPVLYDPNNTSIAMMDRGLLNWVPWAPCFAFGVLLLFAALQGIFLFFAQSETDLPVLSSQTVSPESYSHK